VVVEKHNPVVLFYCGACCGESSARSMSTISNTTNVGIIERYRRMTIPNGITQIRCTRGKLSYFVFMINMTIETNVITESTVSNENSNLVSENSATIHVCIF
jgi:hypothetical protein